MSLLSAKSSHNGMHPAADTTALMYSKRSGRWVVLGVGRLPSRESVWAMMPRVFRALLILLFCSIAHAQDASSGCKSPVEYGNHNQVDPRPQAVRVVSGRVFLQVGNLGGELKDTVPVGEALVGLFTEAGHRLVAESEADGEGRFRLRDVPAGRYRLVVRDPTCLLCVANVPLKVMHGRGRVKDTRGALVIHMRPGGIDDCSYGERK